MRCSMEGMLFFSLRRVIHGLVVSIHLEKIMFVVNINYLHMTYNFKGKLRHLLPV